MTDATEGIRVQVRVLTTGAPQQRFDVHGNEVLQLRGRVVDTSKRHPECVVRFSGQQRAELYRWAKVGKPRHLSVDGYLEVKTWESAGESYVALLIEALNIFPLGDIQEPSRIGVYAMRGRTGAVVEAAVTASPGATKAQRTRQMRDLLERDGG